MGRSFGGNIPQMGDETDAHREYNFTGGIIMKGWTEDEIQNRNLMAPCNEKFKAVMGSVYGTRAEETECRGCMQPDPPEKLYGYCKTCNIRDCVRSKGYYSCHQCGEWPCGHIENFGYKTGIRVAKKAIPVWRDKVAEMGDEKGSIEWARAECERYHCPSCGEPLFRGAQKCRVCKEFVAGSLDGSL